MASAVANAAAAEACVVSSVHPPSLSSDNQEPGDEISGREARPSPCFDIRYTLECPKWLPLGTALETYMSVGLSWWRSPQLHRALLSDSSLELFYCL